MAGRGLGKSNKGSVARKYPQTISNEVLKMWKKCRRSGDIERIAEILEVSAPTVSKALLYGYLTKIDNLEKINDFFVKRELQIQKASDKLLKLSSKK